MRSPAFAALLMSLAAVLVLGCGEAAKVADAKAAQKQAENAERAASLAKLSPEDRKLAEDQGYCAVSSEPLGSMGAPIKMMIEDQPVFICCKGCEGTVESDPTAALAKAVANRQRVKDEMKK
jgi:hypothetical protein